jgi:hypothetical protein
LILLSGICIHYGLNTPQGPPTWDGAEHSLYGLHVYQAVTARDMAAYRDNYAWMTDNMVESDFQTRLERTHSVTYDQSVTFELWHLSNVNSD